MDEIDFLMSVESGGVTTHEGEFSEMAQLDEWLHTPVGSIYGMPYWGNRLSRYKHEPTDDSMAVIIENELLIDLRRDLPNLKLSGIRCDPTGIQDYKIQFFTQNSEFSRSVSTK